MGGGYNSSPKPGFSDGGHCGRLGYGSPSTGGRMLMKSPFPGMDPYIEACGLWAGFHDRLIHKIDETLAQTLPQGYTIDIATRTYIVLVEQEGKQERLAQPDVTITEAPTVKKPRKKKN